MPKDKPLMSVRAFAHACRIGLTRTVTAISGEIMGNEPRQTEDSRKLNRVTKGGTKMPKDKPLMSVRAFAHAYGIGLTQAYVAVHRGEIPAIRIGKRLWIVRATLEKKLTESVRPIARRPSSCKQRREKAID